MVKILQNISQFFLFAKQLYTNKKFKSVKYEIEQEYMLISTCKYFTSQYQTGQQKRKYPIKDDSVVEDCKKDLYDISWYEHIVRYVKIEYIKFKFEIQNHFHYLFKKNYYIS